MVIGQGVVIFARCGGTYVRVHQSRLRKVDEPQVKMEETEEENQIKTDENLLKTPAVVLGEEHYFLKANVRRWHQQKMNCLVLQKTVLL